jgi:hypothetical protein
MRAGLYARVSTHDQQTLPMQIGAMRDYVARRSGEVAIEVQEIGSGASLQPRREELLKAAKRHEIDTNRGLATRSVGTLVARPNRDPSRTPLGRCGIRFVVGGVGHDHAERSCACRDARGLCRV